MPKNNQQNKSMSSKKNVAGHNATVKNNQRKKYIFSDDGKIHITFSEYDSLIEELSSEKFQRDDWWPSEYEIKYYIEPNFELCFEFIVWLVETSEPPVTKENKASKKLLYNILIKYLEFDDDEEDEI